MKPGHIYEITQDWSFQLECTDYNMQLFQYLDLETRLNPEKKWFIYYTQPATLVTGTIIKVLSVKNNVYKFAMLYEVSMPTQERLRFAVPKHMIQTLKTKHLGEVSK